MITKAIVEEVISPYRVKIRIPLLDGMTHTSISTPTGELREASVCVPFQMDPGFKKSDVVYVAFEDDDYSKPFILGYLLTGALPGVQGNVSAETLNITKSAVLGEDTSIGDIGYKDLQDTVAFVRNEIEQRSK